MHGKLACPILCAYARTTFSALLGKPPRNLFDAHGVLSCSYELDLLRPFYGDNPLRIAADHTEWLERTVIASLWSQGADFLKHRGHNMIGNVRVGPLAQISAST